MTEIPELVSTLKKNFKAFPSDTVFEKFLKENTEETWYIQDQIPGLCGGGVLRFTPSASFISTESMPCYMLLYTDDGVGNLTDSDGSLLLPEHSLLFYDCRRPFRLRVSSPVWNVTLFFLLPERIMAYYELLKEQHPVLLRLQPASDIPHYIGRLLAGIPVTTQLQAVAAAKWLTDLLSEMCITMLSVQTPHENIPDYLQEMKALLDRSYQETFRLEDFEKLFSVQKYRLCREFSHYYHTSPLQYLNERRIEAARELLLSTNMRVYEVGIAVGIENTTHFINLFKKYTGTTPHIYRQSAPASVITLHSPCRSDSPEKRRQ